jgi:hypothetical protein
MTTAGPRAHGRGDRASIGAARFNSVREQKDYIFVSAKKIRRIGSFIVSFFLIIFCFVCSQEKNSLPKKPAKRIDAKLKAPISIKSFSDLFEEVRQVPLRAETGFELGPIPSIGAVNQEGDFIILDNYATRQILVFDRTGRGKTRMGSEGKGEGQYLFPDNMLYQHNLAEYFVYDGDLLRVLIFNKNFQYVSKFDIPLYLEELAVMKDGRIFCYTSGAAGPQGIDRVVYECDKNGNILNKFCKQSKNYSAGAESKGGGIVILENNLYVITPYEYIIRKFDLRGKLVKEIRGSSMHYVPITKPPSREALENFQKRQEYHSTWSHIFQIIQIGNEMIGIVFTQPGQKYIFLDLYDLDLKRIASDVLLPEHMIGPHALHTHGNYLWMLKKPVSREIEEISSCTVIVYALRSELVRKIDREQAQD